MGELCRKLGDKIIGDIIPMIKASSESQSAETREGACMAIREVMCVRREVILNSLLIGFAQ